jgi:hypothetical protein
MNKLLTILLILITSQSFAQEQGVYQKLPIYGANYKRIRTDSALLVPVKAQTVNSTDSSAQFYYNIQDSSFWGYSKDRGFFKASTDRSSYHTLGQAPDSTYFTISKPDGTVDTVRFVADTTGGGSSYTLPVASGSTLGGVKIGNTLSIDGSGVLNTTGAEAIHQSNVVSDGAGLVMNHVFNWFNYLNLNANYHTLYIEFPTVSSSGGALKDGYFHEFVFNKNVDSVIFNSEANAFPASMRIRAGDYIKFVYSAADSTWHGGGSSGINTVPVITQSTDPTTAQITIGQSAIYKNSTTGNVYLWANIGGTLYKTQLL